MKSEYFCHRCSRTTEVLNEGKCRFCDSQFVEIITKNLVQHLVSRLNHINPPQTLNDDRAPIECPRPELWSPEVTYVNPKERKAKKRFNRCHEAETSEQRLGIVNSQLNPRLPHQTLHRGHFDMPRV